MLIPYKKSRIRKERARQGGNTIESALVSRAAGAEYVRIHPLRAFRPCVYHTRELAEVKASKQDLLTAGDRVTRRLKSKIQKRPIARR